MDKKAFTASVLIASAMLILPGMPANAQSSPYFQAVTNLNPAAYWPLQETVQPPAANVETNLGSVGAAANAYYASTNAVQGFTPSATPGDGDTAVNFLGNSSGFMIVPTTDSRVSLPAGKPFTVETWAYATTGAQFVSMVNQTGPIGAGGNNAGTNSAGWSLNQNWLPFRGTGAGNNSLVGWSFHVFNGVGSTGGAEADAAYFFSLNQWYHIVGVFDGVNCTVYVNGVNATTYQIPMTGSFVPDIWDPIQFGGNRGLGANPYHGALDEVAIYTNALTPTQVANHYNAAGGSTYASAILSDQPFMYWRMDAPAYTPSPVSSYPVAVNYGSTATGMTNFNTTGNSAVYQPGTVPGVAGPSFSGFGNLTNACAFNGIVGAVDAGYHALLDPSGNVSTVAGSYTLAAWFRGNPTDNNGRWNSLASHSDKSWRLKINNGQSLWNGGTSAQPGIPSTLANVNDGNWHMLVGESDGTNQTLWIDGAVFSSVTNQNQTIIGTNKLDVFLGGAPDYLEPTNGAYNGGQQYLAGRLAHVSFFTNALSAAQIQNLYSVAVPQAPPVIYAQPPSGIRTNNAGTSFLFFGVFAGGTYPLNYRWYHNTTPTYTGATSLSDDGLKYAGSTNYQVTVSNLVAGDSGYYFAIITNNYGSVTSILSGLSVLTTPVITSQFPSGAFSLYPNQNLALSVTASGPAPLTYQWYTNGVSDTTAGTAAAYSLTSVQPANSGFTYQCVVSSSFGSTTGALDTLSVTPYPASIVNSSYATNILALNPAGYWPMHEIAAPSPAAIETNYGSLGALGNGYYADWVTPIVDHQVPGALSGDNNPAAQFYNTPGDCLIIPHMSPLATIKAPYTLEAWIKPLANNNYSTSYQVIMGQGGAKGLNGTANLGGFALQYSGTPNTFSLVIWNGSGGTSYEQKTTPIYPPGVWYHVVSTFDGTNVVYYINGQQASFGTVAGVPGPMNPDSWSPLCIGAGRWGNGGAAQPFIGSMDEVAIYTNLLTASDIQAHYNDGVGGAAGVYKGDVLADNPLFYFRMDSPVYSAPPANTWPVLTNYGTAAVNGVYHPGAAPGAAVGPSEAGRQIANFSGTNAMLGNGVSSYADAGISPTLNPANYTSFSYTAWFKGNPADNRSFQSIMSANDNTWRATLNSSGTVQAHGNADVNNNAVTFNDGNWHQFVLTAQANATAGNYTNALYVDGVLIKSQANNGTNNPGATSQPPPEVLIGDETGFTNNPVGPGRSFAGNICEAAFFYGTAFSSNQVRSIYSSAGVPPFFSIQPVSATVNQGSPFTNNAVANGSDSLIYQWYENNLLLSNQTNASLVLNPVQSGNNSTNYYLVVTNGYGSVTSSVVGLTVFTSPTINSQLPVPYTNLFSLYSGASPTFSISAAGAAPLYYQWYTNGVAVGGATNAAITLLNVQAGLLTNYCIITNFLGSVTSVVWTASVILPPSAPYAQGVLSLNPIGYWRLNEPDDGFGDGNPGVIALDYAGGEDGIYTNVALGQPGYSLSDPETSAQFGAPQYPNPNSDANSIQGIDFSATNASVGFTVSAWVNGSGQFANSAGIVGKGVFNNEEFTLDAGNNLPNNAGKAYRFEVRAANGTAYNANSSLVANDLTWHHLVGVCDEANSNVSFYIDGQLVGSTVIPPGAGILGSNSNQPVTIGARSSGIGNGNDNQFFGRINDVAIFKHALSVGQVRQIYNGSGVPPYITQEPPANVITSEGLTLTIAAADDGTAPVTNLWWDATSNQPIAGQTNTTLVISNVSSALDGHQLYLQAGNSYGATNSTLVTLSIVHGPPQISVDITPRYRVVYAGTPATYSVNANGSQPLYYQWYQNGGIVTDATNSSIALATPLGTNTFSCVVSNTYNGGSIASSATATLVGTDVHTPPYRVSVLADSPIAYWRLDEGPDNGAGNDGTIAHDIVGGHNAFYNNTLLGLPGYNTDDPDTAAGFGMTGTNSYAQELDLSGSGVANLDFSQPSGANAEFSVEAWVNAATNQALNDRIVNKGHFFGEQFALDLGTTSPTTAFRFTIRDANANEFDARSTIVPDGKWHHLVGVCDEANGLIELYVDGVLAATNFNNAVLAPGSGLYAVSEAISIGNADTDKNGAGVYGAQFIGTIDEPALYNYALNSAQVADHYSAGIAQPPLSVGLTIRGLGAGQVQLMWGSATLQSATNVMGPYNDVTNVTSPYTVPTTNNQQFYRTR